MSKPKVHIKRGDTVQVVAGKEKGKKGKVLLVSPSSQKVIVEALNMMTRHERPSQTNPQGGLVQKEAPMHVSNLMVVCSKCGQPARIGRQVLADGSKVRVCKRCSEIIDAG